MITISPEKDNTIIKKLFSENSIEINPYSSAVIAKFGDEVLGYCLYDLDGERMTVHKVTPKEDIMLADGILRSAIHVATERSVMKIFYSKDAPEKLFEQIGFIKDKQEKTLDADKLFGGCGCSE